MSDRERIEVLERQVSELAKRVGELERGRELMRAVLHNWSNRFPALDKEEIA